MLTIKIMPLGTSLQDAIDISVREKRWVKIPCDLSDEEIREEIRSDKINSKECVITRTGREELMIWNPGSSEVCKTHYHQD